MSNEVAGVGLADGWDAGRYSATTGQNLRRGF